MLGEQNHHLELLLQRGKVWQGNALPAVSRQVLQSGIPMLDEQIGGWPRAGLAEILSTGNTGLSLLVPALARLHDLPSWQSWINPPYIPYAPALQARGIDPAQVLLVRNVDNSQALWAGEQALRSGTSHVVLIWTQRVVPAQVRRLQLAAMEGDSLGILFRPIRDRQQSSPAALRLQVQPDHDALQVQVIKRRGGWGGEKLRIPLP